MSLEIYLMFINSTRLGVIECRWLVSLNLIAMSDITSNFLLNVYAEANYNFHFDEIAI